MAIGKYIEYWRWALDEGSIGQYKKDEFDLLLKEMRDTNIMDNLDIANFNEFFRAHNYQSMITCPGITNRISYPKERLDGEFMSCLPKHGRVECNRCFVKSTPIFDQSREECDGWRITSNP